MKTITAFAILAGMGIIATPANAQQRTNPKPEPRQTLQLKAPSISASGSFIRCRVQRVAMSGEGLGFTCVAQDGQAYLVATDGGRQSGGLAAFTNLALKMAEKPDVYRRIRVKEAKGNALKVCGLVRGTSARLDKRTCVQAMSVEMNSQDSSVTTGDADSSYPSVPTQPANPNAPSVPTEPAKPNYPDVPTDSARPD